MIPSPRTNEHVLVTIICLRREIWLYIYLFILKNLHLDFATYCTFFEIVDLKRFILKNYEHFPNGRTYNLENLKFMDGRSAENHVKIWFYKEKRVKYIRSVWWFNVIRVINGRIAYLSSWSIFNLDK